MTTFNRRNVPFTGGAAFVAALLFGTSVFADDAVLRERIEARLAKAVLPERGQVEVAVKDGAAVLTGFTLTLDAQRAAEKAARKETKTVENLIRVTPEKKADDEEVRKAVAEAILRDPTYGVFDSVGVGVEQGRVVLLGSVNQPWRKDDLERRVAQVPGVREITNEIRVQPASFHDDRLRVELYRKIYGNALFERYQSFPDPPIRIIVENGNVTLTGMVNSKVEQVVLGSIASGTLSFKVDNQVQVESDIRKEPAGKTTEG
jgi:hyperosmotically inducible periplasmic protein